MGDTSESIAWLLLCLIFITFASLYSRGVVLVPVGDICLHNVGFDSHYLRVENYKLVCSQPTQLLNSTKLIVVESTEIK